MAAIKIMPATIEDARRIADDVREADRVELYAAAGHTPLEAMQIGISSGEAFTGFVDDVPVIMWGVCGSVLGFVGTVWMVGANMLEKYPMHFLRRCKNSMMKMFENYDILENYVDVRNKKAIQWLRWLGFTIFEPEKYGLFRHEFHRFEKRKPCVAPQQ